MSSGRGSDLTLEPLAHMKGYRSRGLPHTCVGVPKEFGRPLEPPTHWEGRPRGRPRGRVTQRRLLACLQDKQAAAVQSCPDEAHNQALRRAHTARNAQPLRFPLEVGIPSRAADELRCCLPRPRLTGGSVHGLVSRTRTAQSVGRRSSTPPRTCRSTAPMSFAPSIASARCRQLPHDECQRVDDLVPVDLGSAHGGRAPAGTARGSS